MMTMADCCDMEKEITLMTDWDPKLFTIKDKEKQHYYLNNAEHQSPCANIWETALGNLVALLGVFCGAWIYQT